MNEQRDEPDAEPSKAGQSSPMLGYRSGIDERRDRPRLSLPVQATITFLASSFVIVVSGYLGVLMLNSLIGGFVCMLMICGVLAMAALKAGDRDDPHQHGWRIGVWLAIGSVGLIDALCFIVIG